MPTYLCPSSVRLPASARPACGRRGGPRLAASRQRPLCAPPFAGPYYLCRPAGTCRPRYVPAARIAAYALDAILAGPFNLETPHA